MIKQILSIFKGASGLACNMNKCQIAPIRCTQDDLNLISSAFPCVITDFPIKYLGIPLSTHKLPKSALQPLVDQVADHLPIWKDNLMNRSGRLVLCKTTLSAIPIYISISMKLPPWTLKALEKIMKAFLWDGTDVVNGGKCLVA